MAPYHSSQLVHRAEVSVAGIYGIVAVVILTPIIGFCLIIAIIIFQRKRAFKRRQKAFQEEEERRSLIAQQRLVQETWAREDLRGDLGHGEGGPVEMEGGVVDGDGEDGRGRMLDGFAAPPVIAGNGKPLEMPAQTVVR